MTLADRITLARIGLAPLAVLAYLLLPVDGMLCFWGCGLICGLAEFTDWADGHVARARKEVSDFGKLADPFCDVFYRILVFLALLLPAGGVGYAVAADEPVLQLVFVLPGGGTGAGLVPWLPVVLMTMREVVAGALRAMAATRGLVLAARTSGKVKAWLQGVALITMMGYPSLWMEMKPWHLTWAAIITWICAVVSLYSIGEYLWINRTVLRQLTARQPS